MTLIFVEFGREPNTIASQHQERLGEEPGNLASGELRCPRAGSVTVSRSYRLAAIGDAPRVAHELGHTSPQMLYGKYREVVTPEEAERYWQIAPAAESEKLVAFKAGRGV